MESVSRRARRKSRASGDRIRFVNFDGSSTRNGSRETAYGNRTMRRGLKTQNAFDGLQTSRIVGPCARPVEARSDPPTHARCACAVGLDGVRASGFLRSSRELACLVLGLPGQNSVGQGRPTAMGIRLPLQWGRSSAATDLKPCSSLTSDSGISEVRQTGKRRFGGHRRTSASADWC